MKDQSVRLRFAPSPTGPLHIGGVRTALYNYLLAKKHNGSFILRIEDTDQNRYVEGAEQYIQDALSWCGLTLDEGPSQGGDYGPYRQSERGEFYKKYIDHLLQSGWAYKAYDTPEELNQKREQAEKDGHKNWQYDASTRGEMKNSISLSESEVNDLEAHNTAYVIRFKMPKQETVQFVDLIRGKVEFTTDVLDDKVLYKADGYPTYHMANVIDDHEMKISHVIRGEEWLSSTPLHVLLYKALGWENEQPKFAHLPLILKPQGQGKLSKRDGAKFGFPVFPLSWTDPETKELWEGYKETGFIPDGFDNFLAFLGWNPGTDQEYFSIDELASVFSTDRISKSGARFDYDKAKWFNQQHIIHSTAEELFPLVKPKFDQQNYKTSDDRLLQIIDLYKERVELINEFPTQSYYLFDEVREYDEKSIRKKWKPDNSEHFLELAAEFSSQPTWDEDSIEQTVKLFMEKTGFGFGQVLPTLRLAICGTMKGPSIYSVMELLGQEESAGRLTKAIPYFTSINENHEAN